MKRKKLKKYFSDEDYNDNGDVTYVDKQPLHSGNRLRCKLKNSSKNNNVVYIDERPLNP